jgi:hypothetical protein
MKFFFLGTKKIVDQLKKKNGRIRKIQKQNSL